MNRVGYGIAVLYFGSQVAHAGDLRHTARAEHTNLKRDGEATQGPAAKPFARAEIFLQSTSHQLQTTLHQWLHALSLAAVITTICLQLSPLPSSLEIKGARCVKRYDGYPYFSVLAGATQWCIYGSFAAYTLHDPTLLTMVAANGPGIIFGIFYVSTYLSFVPASDGRCTALKRYLKFGLALLLAELVGCFVLGHSAVFWLGLLGAVGSAQIALSPFKTLPEVLRSRSTRSWPLDLCLWNFIQSAATGGFGVANNDAWVWVPNAIGVVAAVFQLALIAAFREGSTRTASAVKLPRSTMILS